MILEKIDLHNQLVINDKLANTVYFGNSYQFYYSSVTVLIYQWYPVNRTHIKYIFHQK